MLIAPMVTGVRRPEHENGETYKELLIRFHLMLAYFFFYYYFIVFCLVWVVTLRS